LKDKSRISGKDATYVAREALKRRPIPLLASEGVEQPPQTDVCMLHAHHGMSML
jgi:hypothetical protein